MPVPSTIADLSTTAASNSPAGSESPTTADDYLRSIQAIIKTQDNLNARKGANTDITSLTGLSGNLSFTATGNRITGDFSNATFNNRILFQTSTVNGSTAIGTIPNGTGTVSGINFTNTSNTTNYTVGSIYANSAEVAINSSKVGTGVFIPVKVYTSDIERIVVATSGEFRVQGRSASLGASLELAKQDNTLAYYMSVSTGTLPSLSILNGSNAGVVLSWGATSWSAVSDEKKKDIIEPILNGLDKVNSLRAVIGKYKTDEEGVRRSFLIAQDVQKVLPEAISVEDDGALGLRYTEVIPLLIAAIKELSAEVNALKNK